MKAKYFIILFIIIQAVTLTAQNKFKSGSYTDTSGEVYTGFIAAEKWNVNPTKIVFKASIEDEPVTIQIQNLKNFYIDNLEFYQKETILIDIESQISFQNLVEKQVLLKVLIEGDASLYSYSDTNNTNFYYAIKDGSPILLNQKKKIANGNHVYDINKVRQELLNVFSNCPSINQEIIGRIKYSEPSLANFFVEYNTCLNAEQKSYRSPSNVDFKLGLFLGYDFSNYDGIDIRNLRDTGLLTTTIQDADFGTQRGLVYGLELELINIRYGISGFTSVMVLPQYDTTTTIVFSGAGGGEIETRLFSKFITVTFGGRKYFDISNDVKVYGGLGISLHFPGNNALNFGEITRPYFDENDYPSMLLNVGLQYNFLFLESRFNIGQKAFTSNIGSFNLILGAKFL